MPLRRPFFVGNPALRMRPRVSATVAAIAIVILSLAIAPAALARSTASAAAGSQAVEYRLPYLAGQSYRVTQSWRTTYTHKGHSAYAYDFGLPEGTPVVAAAAGIVAYAQDGHRRCGDEGLRNAANFVTIYHADGTATLYAHLSRVSVRVGQVVTGGEVIGLSGKSGFTGCEPHLHFARQRQGHAVTQSIPVYFIETGRHQLRRGVEATSHNPICSQSSAGMPDGAFCAAYTTATDRGPRQIVRLERTIHVAASPTVGKKAAPSTPPAADTTAMWIGRFTFSESGMYTFTVTSESDVQLWIDGAVAIDTVTDPIVAGDHVRRIWMSSGQHVMQVEDRSVGAYLRVDWRDTGPGTAVELN